MKIQELKTLICKISHSWNILTRKESLS